MMKLKLIPLLLFTLISSVVFADAREENALQTQMLITMGTNNTHPVESGPGAGLHLGYHFNKRIYFGLSGQTTYLGNDPYGDNNKGNNGDYDAYDKDYEIFGQEGVDDTDSEIGNRYQAEIRVFPWDFGLYFSGGVLSQGKDKIKTTFDKRSRNIGENTYTTGLEATLEYEAKTVATAGVGFQHVFKNGLSLGAGGNFGISPAQEADVEVVTINPDAAVSTTDLASWKEDIEDNERRIPVFIYLAIGYNF